jgi:type IX secretion system PorP/SprF family membrane protein
MKKILIIINFLMLLCALQAQDPQFSQFYAAPLYLGPSMAGTAGCPRVCLNFRDQWPNLPGKYVTSALSVDNYVSNLNSGIGMLFLYDNAGGGKLTTTQIGLNYSYRIKIKKDFFFQPGLQFLYYQRTVDFSRLTFADQFYDEQILPSSIESPPDNQNGHIDFSTSILGFAKNLWFGTSLDHLMKMNTALTNDIRYVPLKISAYGGYRVHLTKPMLNKEEEEYMTLAFHYRSQASMQQLDFGVYYNKLPYTVGVWYRGIPVIKSTKSNDAITFSGGLMFKNLLLTYSYDFTISSLIGATGGAHEIALVYTFEQTKKSKRKMGSVPCPKL